ncbi:MAG TPA: polyribonucleotide nucleotidyltransferase [Gemmatimonadales bacterium]|nr:polyribonucleotide nucleotidyltransferase [Gemmatimonadales bacterium]
MMHRIERAFAGRTFRIECGRLAKQAAGSALVQFGDTVVLAAASVADTQSSLPFFPLLVEYREKFYAAGKIPGGFLKREARPNDEEILSARIIDRTIRPLFPEGFRNEVQVYVYVLSADQENDADTLGVIAASFALASSKIPFAGPVAAVRVGRVEGKWILNPTFQQLEFSDIDIVVSGSKDSIVMVEGGAAEVGEQDMLAALKVAQKGIQELVAVQEELLAKHSAPKMEWTRVEPPAELKKRVEELAAPRVAEAMNLARKEERAQALAALTQTVKAQLEPEFPDQGRLIGELLEEIQYHTMRRQVLERGERIDGRDTETVRPITCEVGMLPRTHGSALFTRGQTQALVTATLGSVDDEQRIDNIDAPRETTKSFMLHYNFPPFSTGEVRPMRGTSRREIGHGALAERAITPLLPPYNEFPYTIRVVSEILESNGSSSMATVCGASLALMDAGVPLKAPCAGVAMGLIKEGDAVAILTDILGTEDALGDMDFKVAGTEQGITSIQMDIKIQGLSLDIMAKALDQAKRGRLHILQQMNKTLARHRSEMSPFAPRVITIQVDQKDIGKIIGPKGATIRDIEEQSGAKVSIDDDGIVTIAAVGGEAGMKAREMVESLVVKPEIGKTYTGKVKTTTAFGAFVEILPGVEGLVHISELQHGRTERTEDVVKKGDTVTVKLLEIDERGKMRLSRKALIPKE